jgi:cytochrome c-type biogenesis protein CcmE
MNDSSTITIIVLTTWGIFIFFVLYAIHKNLRLFIQNNDEHNNEIRSQLKEMNQTLNKIRTELTKN